MDDAGYMKRALVLARRAWGRTSPNPMVGAVVVRAGRVLAEDYHRKAGSPHAEALALARAGEKARGSTLYVSLEPCSHINKRTPPCADAIINAGVRRAVVAMKDPNPRVNGRGIRKLQEAGIKVVVGMLEEEASALNEAYIKYITTKRPLVILKTAMTLDGKIANPAGQSKWITGEKARLLVHRIRGRVDAVITAIGTVKADDPELTARVRGGIDPVRVLIDPTLEVPLDARILKVPPETIVVTRVDNYKANNIINTGIKMVFYKDKLELDWLMSVLAEMGMMSVLIEGGSSLNAHALEEQVVDRVMFFIAPKILGGRESYPAVGGSIYRTIGGAFRLRDMKVRRIGEDILVEGRVGYP